MPERVTHVYESMCALLGLANQSELLDDPDDLDILQQRPNRDGDLEVDVRFLSGFRGVEVEDMWQDGEAESLGSGRKRVVDDPCLDLLA
jgi:hypothetical protein